VNSLRQIYIRREWLGYEEARRLVGLSRSTLHTLVKRGEIKAARIGRSVKINRASLDEYMERKVIGDDVTIGDGGENATEGYEK
jgi:excisionase family DNA binding protein